MSDPRRIGALAIFVLVILRLSIGWQLLSEGTWKLKKEGTSDPWSAEPYLKNAQGPLRDHFRNLSGDPEDKNWLDSETVIARWTAWAEAFTNHYELDETQKKNLTYFLDGRDDYRGEIKDFIPEGTVESINKSSTLKRLTTITPPVDVNKDGKIESKVDKTGRFIIDGEQHMTASERRALEKRIPAPKKDDPEYAKKKKQYDSFRRAVSDAFKRSSRLSLKERVMVSLDGNPDRAGATYEQFEGTTDYKKVGDIEIYRDLANAYESGLKNAETDFQFDHLNSKWKDISTKRSELVGPVKAMEKELKVYAMSLLTTDQLLKGPPEEPMTEIRKLNLATMWGLTIIGCCLIGGLFTRLAALGGVVMLGQFYLAYPPFPGYPPVSGTDHALIVNKLFVEIIALFAFVFLPSGRWFGIDGIFARMFMGSSSK